MPDSPDAPKVVAALQAANGQLRGENAELKAENAELRERIARLERLISRSSGNSSMPPSSDDLSGHKPPERKARRGGGRRPGKQPGAPGAYLAWREDPQVPASAEAALRTRPTWGCGIRIRSQTCPRRGR